MKTAAQTETEAAEWLARRDAGDWDDADQSALDLWMEESLSNKIAFLRLESAWNMADRLRASALNPVDVEVDSEVEPGAEIVELPRRPVLARVPKWIWPSAAAAMLALIVVPFAMRTEPAQVYSTPVGGFQDLPLADGSRIELNTDTQLSVDFSDDERRVRMSRGEAFFEVAKDEARPFVVQAGDYRVIAVGTAFSVRYTGNDIDVAVTEGKVRVEGPARTDGTLETAFVSAGQIADAEATQAVVRPAPAGEIDRSLAWRDRLLVFDNRPLGEVAAEFNRYNQQKLVVDQSAVGVMVDGTFKPGNIGGFVRLLDQGFDVVAERTPDGRILLRVRR
ncbi:FecR family protein [Pelagerythrobacter aerophilus]|nr:FecR domain-containing protein [Pelagerythrobacter aerophilus]